MSRYKVKPEGYDILKLILKEVQISDNSVYGFCIFSINHSGGLGSSLYYITKDTCQRIVMKYGTPPDETEDQFAAKYLSRSYYYDSNNVLHWVFRFRIYPRYHYITLLYDDNFIYVNSEYEQEE